MAGMNKLRKKLSLRPRYGNALWDGDLILFPDIPEFNPVSRMPANAHYVGPLTWRNNFPSPGCIGLLNPSRPCAYFTIGSEGLEEIIETLGTLAEQSIQVIVATGKMSRDLSVKLPSNIFLETFVNTDKVLPYCDLVVCHGGNGTIYQALANGLPIVGFATHEEQNYGLKRVNQLELGLGFKSKVLQKKGAGFLVNVIDRVLGTAKYQENAKNFQGRLQAWHGAAISADLIERFFN
jgi:UDP:flavonoid glycosyltransferase YjiC (YdhE family)